MKIGRYLMGQLTHKLRREHEEIFRSLITLKRIMDIEDMDAEKRLEAYGDFVDYFKIYVDRIHDQKEEVILFPALEEKEEREEEGLLSKIFHEHELGRELVDEMQDAVKARNIQGFQEAAREYIELMKNHIDYENRELLVVADELLSEEEQEPVLKGANEFEEEILSEPKHANIAGTVDRWERELGLN